jgi:hypothetical protein
LLPDDLQATIALSKKLVAPLLADAQLPLTKLTTGTRLGKFEKKKYLRRSIEQSQAQRFQPGQKQQIASLE